MFLQGASRCLGKLLPLRPHCPLSLRRKDIISCLPLWPKMNPAQKWEMRAGDHRDVTLAHSSLLSASVSQLLGQSGIGSGIRPTPTTLPPSQELLQMRFSFFSWCQHHWVTVGAVSEWCWTAPPPQKKQNKIKKQQRGFGYWKYGVVNNMSDTWSGGTMLWYCVLKQNRCYTFSRMGVGGAGLGLVWPAHVCQRLSSRCFTHFNHDV